MEMVDDTVGVFWFREIITKREAARDNPMITTGNSHYCGHYIENFRVKLWSSEL